jgi:hypothetical protein
MTSPAPPPDSQLARRLAIALEDMRAAATCLAAALDAAAATALEQPLQRAIQPTVKPAPVPADPAAEHRRAHRSGVLSRITRDPEVEAFILGIIETMTYAQVVEAVARTFPPARHISSSSLHRWWRKRSPAEDPQSAVPSSY